MFTVVLYILCLQKILPKKDSGPLTALLCKFEENPVASFFPQFCYTENRHLMTWPKFCLFVLATLLMKTIGMSTRNQIHAASSAFVPSVFGNCFNFQDPLVSMQGSESTVLNNTV
jgi:hypothetical protein